MQSWKNSSFVYVFIVVKSDLAIVFISLNCNLCEVRYIAPHTKTPTNESVGTTYCLHNRCHSAAREAQETGGDRETCKVFTLSARAALWVLNSTTGKYCSALSFEWSVHMIVCTGSLELRLYYWLSVNPLSHKSDQHQISPCNINAL